MSGQGQWQCLDPRSAKCLGMAGDVPPPRTGLPNSVLQKRRSDAIGIGRGVALRALGRHDMGHGLWMSLRQAATPQGTLAVPHVPQLIGGACHCSVASAPTPPNAAACSMTPLLLWFLPSFLPIRQGRIRALPNDASSGLAACIDTPSLQSTHAATPAAGVCCLQLPRNFTRVCNTVGTGLPTCSTHRMGYRQQQSLEPPKHLSNPGAGRLLSGGEGGGLWRDRGGGGDLASPRLCAPKCSTAVFSPFPLSFFGPRPVPLVDIGVTGCTALQIKIGMASPFTRSGV